MNISMILPPSFPRLLLDPPSLFIIHPSHLQQGAVLRPLLPLNISVMVLRRRGGSDAILDAEQAA